MENMPDEKLVQMVGAAVRSALVESGIKKDILDLKEAICGTTKEPEVGLTWQVEQLIEWRQRCEAEGALSLWIHDMRGWRAAQDSAVKDWKQLAFPIFSHALEVALGGAFFVVVAHLLGILH